MPASGTKAFQQPIGHRDKCMGTCLDDFDIMDNKAIIKREGQKCQHHWVMPASGHDLELHGGDAHGDFS